MTKSVLDSDREAADVRVVARILREGTPLVDDPARRAATRARIEREAERRARPWRASSARYAMPMVLLLLLLAGLPATAGVGTDLESTVRAATDGLQSVLNARPGADDDAGSMTDDRRYGAGATLALPPALQRMAELAPDPARFAMTHWNPAQVISNQLQAGGGAPHQQAPYWAQPWQQRVDETCQQRNGVQAPLPTPGALYGQRCV